MNRVQIPLMAFGAGMMIGSLFHGWVFLGAAVLAAGGVMWMLRPSG